MRKKIRSIDDISEIKRYIGLFSKKVSIEDVNHLTDHQYSRNSLLAMTKDWNLFVEFCTQKNVSPIPAATTALRMFIEKESIERKYATIKRYLVTIGLFHRILTSSDPSAHSSVKIALSKIRLDKVGDAKATDAFEKKHLEQITKLLGHSDKARDIRNLAIYYIMYECLLKRSELRNLSIQQIVYNNDCIKVAIGDNLYTLSPNACEHLSRWINLRGLHGSTLFTAIDKHGNMNNEPLDDSSIYRILRSASDKLGLDLKFSGQSLRVGAAKELAKQGNKVSDIQHYGRWLSAAMPYYYIGNKAQADTERMVFKRFKPWD